jgi:hypothetical protein
VPVNFHGSTWGTPMLKVRFIGRDMRMEFFHPLKGIVRTSRVRDIHERKPSSATETALLRKAS